MFEIRKALDGWYVVHPDGTDFEGPMSLFAAEILRDKKNKERLEQAEEPDEGLSPS